MQTSRRFLLVPAIAALALLAPRAGSAQTFYATGDPFVGLVDPHWFVAYSNVSFVQAYANGFFPAYQVQNSPWPAHNGPPGPTQTNWISNIPSGSNYNESGYINPSYYVFRQTFDLTGYQPETASLSFIWGCDGGFPYLPVPGLSLNLGPLIGGSTCGGYNVNASTGMTIASGFVSGLNTLDVEILGDGQTDGMALANVEFGATVTPEPATLALLGTGLLSLAAGMWRRGKKA